MIERSRELVRKDIALVINNNYVLESNHTLLSLNSKFFRAILNSFKGSKPS